MTKQLNIITKPLLKNIGFYTKYGHLLVGGYDAVGDSVSELWTAGRRRGGSDGAPHSVSEAKWNMDEEVAESWEEAADSGVSNESLNIPSR